MVFSTNRRAGAAKVIGVAARQTLKAIVREAVAEAIRELEDRGEIRGAGGVRGAGSGSGRGRRSLLLLGVGVAAGYLLAKRPPSWLRTAEESIPGDVGGPLEQAQEAIEDRSGTATGAGGGGSGAGTRGSVDSETID